MFTTSLIPPSDNANKRKRRPAGTPDPDAEVVALSPRTLLESDKYVCEICNQGFQRDQNLQMHRRRHKVPWKLLKRDTPEVRKRVFVCPEPSCLHHDPCHALGDLVGIKKHYKRKHSNHKQWVCAKCSKAYAVHSDFKAHLKTCGTRGHSCDCGRVFSRVESFIEHQDSCSASRTQSNTKKHDDTQDSRTGSNPNSSSPSDTNLSNIAQVRPTNLKPPFLFQSTNFQAPYLLESRKKNYELQLLPTTSEYDLSIHRHKLLNLRSSCLNNEANGSELQLTIGLQSNTRTNASGDEATLEARNKQNESREQIMHALKEREMAEREFAEAKRLRHQARIELSKAMAIREQSMTMINSTMMQVTCQACKNQYQVKLRVENLDENSSVVTEGWVSPNS